MVTIELKPDVIEFLNNFGIVFHYSDESIGYQFNNQIFQSTDVEGLYLITYIEQEEDDLYY